MSVLSVVGDPHVNTDAASSFDLQEGIQLLSIADSFADIPVPSETMPSHIFEQILSRAWPLEMTLELYDAQIAFTCDSHALLS